MNFALHGAINGIYGDVSRLSGQRYRFSGTGAVLGKEGSFECLRVKLGMKLIFSKKSIDSKQFTVYTIGRSSDGKEKAKWQKENYR